MDAPEKVHVVRREKRPLRVVGRELALATHIRGRGHQAAELGQGQSIDVKRGGDRRAGDPNVFLVGRDRQLNQPQKVLEVGLGFDIALQLLDREMQLCLVAA